ncbi:Hypothetical predicted protein [Pelobates cultripes]|uniref:Uncharacterized protein n=1 Tax=Pelobates cultripes TaxID=61616 RepID=A0AAD1RRD9_PELCU|nr:Hypothetical predicted protein [Pelobates cultripes]
MRRTPAPTSPAKAPSSTTGVYCSLGSRRQGSNQRHQNGSPPHHQPGRHAPGERADTSTEAKCTAPDQQSIAFTKRPGPTATTPTNRMSTKQQPVGASPAPPDKEPQTANKATNTNCKNTPSTTKNPYLQERRMSVSGSLTLSATRKYLDRNVYKHSERVYMIC